MDDGLTSLPFHCSLSPHVQTLRVLSVLPPNSLNFLFHLDFLGKSSVMAPKLKFAIAKRWRNFCSIEKRAKCWLKTFEGQSAPPHSPPPPPPRLFTVTRVVTTGWKVDFQFLKAEHFRIGLCIHQQGWEKICSLEVPTYRNLVREFFENLRCCGEFVESTVKGVQISLSERQGRF